MIAYLGERGRAGVSGATHTNPQVGKPGGECGSTPTPKRGGEHGNARANGVTRRVGRSPSGEMHCLRMRRELWRGTIKITSHIA